MKLTIRYSLVLWLASATSWASLAVAGNDAGVAGLPRFCQWPQAREVRPMPSNPRGVVLSVSQKRVEAGAFVYARPLNFGDAAAGYGREFLIERYGPAGWATDPSSPDGPWLKSLGKLPPGAAGRCYGFQIPEGQVEGRYRFSTKVFLKAGASARRVSEFLVQ